MEALADLAASTALSDGSSVAVLAQMEVLADKANSNK